MRPDVWLGAALVPAVVGGTLLLMALVRAAWPALHNVTVNPFEAVIRTPADAFVLGIAGGDRAAGSKRNCSARSSSGVSNSRWAGPPWAS